MLFVWYLGILECVARLCNYTIGTSLIHKFESLPGLHAELGARGGKYENCQNLEGGGGNGMRVSKQFRGSPKV